MNLWEITDENLDDLATTAWYGGITYWAGGAPADHPASGARFVLVDREGGDGKVYEVTDHELRRAFMELADVDQKHVNDTIHGYFLSAVRDRTPEDGIEMGSIDAEAADVWVQVAAFGEVVYG